MEDDAMKSALEEERRNKTQMDLQDRYRLDLEREKMVSRPSQMVVKCLFNPFELNCKVTCVRLHTVPIVFVPTPSGASADGGAGGPEVQ